MELTDFSIPLRSLSNGDHTFSFKAGSDLFTRVENALVNDGDLDVEVNVHKTDLMAVLNFDISGSIKATCDICLGEFDYPIDECTGTITVKFGDHSEEIDEDLYIIDEAEERLDLAQWIYELVCVILPIRFEHPEDENGNPTCDPDMLNKLDEYLVESEDEVKEKARAAQDGATDPRWDALKSLLNKGN